MRAESTLQRQIRDYLAVRGFQSVAVPNGAVLAGTKQQRAIQAANLKREGMMPGFVDLIVFASGGRVAFIEVKTPKGTIQPTQRACGAWLASLGHHYAIVRSLDDVDAALVAWGWRLARGIAA